MKITARQACFITEYLKDLNATQAAIRAGYSEKTANKAGPALLVNLGIQQAIAARQAQRFERAELTAVRVLEEMRRLAFSDPRALFDTEGNLKPLHTLTDEEAACIASLEVVIKNAEAGDGHTDTVHKIKCWDKVRTLEMLGKHFALLTERLAVEHRFKLEDLVAGSMGKPQNP